MFKLIEFDWIWFEYLHGFDGVNDLIVRTQITCLDIRLR